MISKDAIPFYNKMFKQLVGAQILDFKMEPCECEPDAYWPTFKMKLASDTFSLVLSQDEEGNGGGFAFIEDIKNERA